MTRVAPCDNISEGHQCQRFNEMELPSCAVIGGRGTVIVRIMGACEVCSRPVYWPQDVSSRRSCLLKCELCSRTSFYCRCSDCDSVLDRPYKRSAARNRDFNVCTAICLLLLAGGLTPRSSAAPFGKMDRTNSTDWENPCDYVPNDLEGKMTVGYSSTIPESIASEANITLRKVKQYQDVFANETNSFQRYEHLLARWPRNFEWLRNISWVAKVKLLPTEHTFNSTFPDEKIEELIKSEEDLRELLPHMHRGLKLVMASWGKIIVVLKETYPDLAEKMSDTYYKMKTVLCSFYNLMQALNLPTDTTFDEEDLPKLDTQDKNLNTVLVFRDSVYYLEYLRQFFSIMARIKP